MATVKKRNLFKELSEAIEDISLSNKGRITLMGISMKKKYFVKVSAKGRITIPIEIRTIMNIHPGDIIIFEQRGKNILLKKSEAKRGSKKKFIQALSKVPDIEPENFDKLG